MKRYKFFMMFLATIICLLFIQISYNGTPSVSLFSFFIVLINDSIKFGFNFKEGFNLGFDDFLNNYLFVLIEFLIVSFLGLISSLLNKVKLIGSSLILFIILWLFWAIRYKGLIEIDLYLISSIPFLLSCLFLGFMILRKKRFLRIKNHTIRIRVKS